MATEREVSTAPGDETWRIGIDAGGTFTDVMAVSSRGEIRVVKVPSTPSHPVSGPINGLNALRPILGVGARIEDVAHGTTVGLNALLQRRFPPVALLCTKGFRHVLEIARHTVPGQWGSIYSWVKPERVVPLENILEVSERIDASGAVLEALDEVEVRQLAETLARRGVGTVAVCLLNSYRNPAHEQRIKEILLSVKPDWMLSISSEVMPEFREYERMVTTATNAVLAPLIGRYMAEFDRLARTALREDDARVYVMRSAGGVVTAREAAEQPLRTALSGPAGGVLGMARVAMAAGISKVITFDMGGTSTDVAAVEDGRPHLTTDAYIDIYPLRTPTIDIVTIGAGGGSVISVGTAGRLVVGPRSAGAEPGPACYARGGDEPTITDANLMLGRLPSALVGGSMRLDVKRAECALEGVGRQLGLSAPDLAFSALEIAVNNMAGAVREVSVRRGLDPRDYTLVAFGGAGPPHAARLAQLVGIQRVLVPPYPGLGSCLGLVLADVVVDTSQTCVQRDDDIDLPRLQETLNRLEASIVTRARDNGVEQPILTRSADLRYVGMGTEINVALSSGPLTMETLGKLFDEFHQEHQRRYEFSYPGTQHVELVALRVEAHGVRSTQVPAGPILATTPREVAPTGKRMMQLALATPPIPVPVFDRQTLPTDWSAEGPVLVDQYDTTTVVLEGQRVAVDAFGNLLLSIGDR